jgi:hypothetical protein
MRNAPWRCRVSCGAKTCEAMQGPLAPVASVVGGRFPAAQDGRAIT